MKTEALSISSRFSLQCIKELFDKSTIQILLNEANQKSGQLMSPSIKLGINLSLFF